MVREGIKPGGPEVFRPRRRLVARSIIAALSLVVPLLIVLYWLTIPSNAWIIVAGVQVVLTVLGLVAVFAVRKIRVTVTPHSLESRNLLGRVTTLSTTDIASGVLVNLYQSGSVETLPHLYLLDADGDVLLRFWGQIWPRSVLENLIDTLGVAVVRLTDPLTEAELGRIRPQLVRRRTRQTARTGL
jgi:hypothetical protein